MRTFIVLTIILGSLPFCFARPYIGIFMWAWISYMNPHRLTWSHAVKYFPVAQYVGIATLLGYLFTKERDKLPLEREGGGALCKQIIEYTSVQGRRYPGCVVVGGPAAARRLVSRTPANAAIASRK